jgi:hypothetical protein
MILQNRPTMIQDHSTSQRHPRQFPLSGGRDVMQNRPIILHNPAIIFIKRPVQWQHQENAKKGELYAKCELGTRSYPSF